MWRARCGRCAGCGSASRIPAWRGATRGRCAPRWSLALVAALVIAGPDAPARLAAALEPTLPRTPGAPATELQAWITPPAYTRLAPMFLKADGGGGRRCPPAPT